jgi:hypothetical protein
MRVGDKIRKGLYGAADGLIGINVVPVAPLGFGGWKRFIADVATS